MITGDEKWIVYNNVKRKRSWSKRDEHAEALEKQIFTKERLCCQSGGTLKVLCILSCLRGIKPLIQTYTVVNWIAIKQKRRELVNRKGVVFHHDNARPRRSLVTREKLLQLGWDVLPHPPYSPDLAPSDYHLFRSLQNALSGKTLTADENMKSFLELFLLKKIRTFLSAES
ncbi:Histone-lysine N-methyltransferase SETMAR [Ooceraea biroi]|uniref:Histone-lysine N-methyltransferase SETMAR n=1 Tax=Ooceraea biroi TaxID=2015173 RepID=A0A026WMT7_OOCBI|nr:Histone-lysine N-methyltransferase SETMAR [Ooceraea biroi]